MLALTWVISIAISSPIALGMNYTERRAKTPSVCTFYNSDFLIYSSMGSFYIPCIVMTLLYWRIFHAIRQRARKSKAASAAAPVATNVQQRKRSGGRSSAQPSAAEPEVVIVNRPLPTSSPSRQPTHLNIPPPPPPQVTTATSETEDNCSTPHRHLLPPGRRQQQQTELNVVDCHVTTCVDDTDVDGGVYDGGGGTPEVNSCGETTAAKDSASDRKSFRGPENGTGGRVRGCSYCAPTAVVLETADECDGQNSDPNARVCRKVASSPSTASPAAAVPVAGDGNGKPAAQWNGGGHGESAGHTIGATLLKLKSRATTTASIDKGGGTNGGRKPVDASGSGQKRFVTRFTFGLKKANGKKSADQQKPRGGAHNAQRRERKATKTLAIVLG